VDSESVRNFLTHLAVQRGVSASTQNQAPCAVVFLCREVLGTQVEGFPSTTRAKRGERDAGGLRVSECSELRVKDLDFDQGLVFVRSGKGDKDRTTLLAESGREELRAHVTRCEALHKADRLAGLAGVWMPDALNRKYPNAGRPTREARIVKRCAWADGFPLQ
jgi:integrase